MRKGSCTSRSTYTHPREKTGNEIVLISHALIVRMNVLFCFSALYFIVCSANESQFPCTIKFVNPATSNYLTFLAPGFARLEFDVEGSVPQLWVQISNSTSTKSGISLLNTIVPVINGKASVMFDMSSWPFGSDIWMKDNFRIYAESAAKGKRCMFLILLFGFFFFKYNNYYYSSELL